MTDELYKNKEDIKKWLKKYHILNYELIEDSKYGYIVNVNQFINLWNKNLKSIKVKFNIINGGFDCSKNNLISLKGCPEKVTENFNCSFNELKNLEYCPKIINSNFLCNDNKLNTIEYFPENVNEGCYLINNTELGEIQNIHNFEELKKIHESIILNKNLEKKIIIDNSLKNIKIKL